MTAAISISRYRHLHATECEGCHTLDQDATRRDCRAHAQQTGHIVRYLIEDVTVYQPEGSPA